MKRSLFLRILLIGSLTLLLFVPLLFLQTLIESRVEYRDEAIQSVVQSFASQQSVFGPAIVIPYVVSWQEQEELRNGGYKTIERSEKRFLYFFPTTLHIQSELPTSTRSRGIFNVETYKFIGSLNGHFNFVVPKLPLQTGETLVRLFQPELVLKISDIRGLVGTPSLDFDGQTLAWGKNTETSNAFSPALYYALPPLEPGHSLQAEFKINLTLNGTRSISIFPIADDNTVYMRSPWPHPDFRGEFLPTTRDVKDTGFNATWKVSSLASNAQSHFDSRYLHAENGLVVKLINPVEPYTLATRASKYGFLFIALSFAAFFFMEGLKQLRVHPIQYLLVGASMALFFLLLLSLSEHMPFGFSYAVAAGASLGLLAFYLCFVFKSVKLGLGFATLLCVLFTSLYGLLLGEDYALLLGSALLFICLTAAMVLSRKLDWYALSAPKTLPPPPAPSPSEMPPPSRYIP
ncbi:MAG: cell envelope integrity protein CreD, partial [Cystobacterineae bacterium]|nr:cell envelope integrity protein CreD [Cystobacterineae bacterium]